MRDRLFMMKILRLVFAKYVIANKRYMTIVKN